MTETIVAAAIRISVPPQFRREKWNGKRVYPDYLTISAPAPARHGTLIHPFGERTKMHIGPDDQGFLTSTGRYVGRVEALNIALTAKQPFREDGPFRDHGGHQLYSEDLW